MAEIQESSNLTYRLYDYDRIGKDGKKRELHIDKALDVADLYGSTEPRQPLRVLKYRPGMASELLIRCKYFEVYRMLINTERRQTVHYRADRMAFRYYCAWMAVARYPMMRELLIFIRETVCLCRRIQKSLRFTDRRSSLISEDKIQNSRVWGKTGR